MNWYDDSDGRDNRISEYDLKTSILDCLNSSHDRDKEKAAERLVNKIDKYIDQKIKSIKVTVDNG